MDAQRHQTGTKLVIEIRRQRKPFLGVEIGQFSKDLDSLRRIQQAGVLLLVIERHTVLQQHGRQHTHPGYTGTHHFRTGQRGVRQSHLHIVAHQLGSHLTVFVPRLRHGQAESLKNVTAVKLYPEALEIRQCIAAMVILIGQAGIFAKPLRYFFKIRKLCQIQQSAPDRQIDRLGTRHSKRAVGEIPGQKPLHQ